MQGVIVWIFLIKKIMERILSEEKCSSIIKRVETQEWQRVDYHCHYQQSFIEDDELAKTFQDFFGKEFISKPIMKVLKLNQGDALPIYSGDYDSSSDSRFDRYKGTNFIIESYLNNNFEGGNISLINNTYEPRTGYGIIQKKSNICSISKVTKGTAYFIFCYVKGFKSNNLL